MQTMSALKMSQKLHKRLISIVPSEHPNEPSCKSVGFSMVKVCPLVGGRHNLPKGREVTP